MVAGLSGHCGHYVTSINVVIRRKNVTDLATTLILKRRERNVLERKRKRPFVVKKILNLAKVGLYLYTVDCVPCFITFDASL